MTNIERKAGYGTYVISLVIIALGGYFGCCVIPFFIDECLDTIHKCPNCNQICARVPICGKARVF